MGTGERISSVAWIVASRRFEDPFVVVSAMSGVTDTLLGLSKAAQNKDRTGCDNVLRLLSEKHVAAVDSLSLSESEAAHCREEISKETARLSELAMGVSLLGELSPRSEDAIAASGELLASLLLAAVLRRDGHAAIRIDPREWMLTDATYGCAIPDERGIAARVKDRVLPAAAQGKLVVTGGFAGSAPDGSITTLGRGGSDFSAALLGAGLHDNGCPVSAIEIWTDVDGILTADPRIVPSAKLVEEVGYSEAAELAFFGAKVLHPATIRPAVTRGIPVKVLNTFRPQAKGTTVIARAAGDGVRALAMRRKVTALFVSNPRMLLAYGFAARVFSVFEKLRVPVDVITTSEVSISITVDDKSPIGDLVRELSEFAEVEILKDLAVVSVVGRNMRSTPGIAARVFKALKDINVILISQGATETNMTFVIEAAHAPKALQLLHREFFE